MRAITGQLAIFDLGVDKVQAYIDQLANAGNTDVGRIPVVMLAAFVQSTLGTSLRPTSALVE